MNKFWILAPLAILLPSCAPQPQVSTLEQAQPVVQNQAPTAPAKLTAAQELAKYCRVCVVDKGEKMEEFLPSRLATKHDGQTYKFCSEPCRKAFDVNKKKYAVKVSTS